MAQAAPPRHLVRRLLGYAIDMAAAWLIVAVIFAATGYSRLNQYFDTTQSHYEPSSQISLGSFALALRLEASRCGLAPHVITALIDLPAGASFDGPAKVCDTNPFSMPTALHVTRREVISGVKQPTKLDLTFNTPPLNLAGLLCIILLIATSALSLHLLPTTLGKRLTGLKFAHPTPPQTNAFAIIVALLHANTVLALRPAPQRRKGLPFAWSSSAEVISIRPHNA